MSMEREGTILSKNASDIQEIEVRLRQYSEAEKRYEMTYDASEHSRLFRVFDRICRDLVDLRAENIIECQLKASVLKKMMSDFQEDNYLDYFIEHEADSYEAVAMSVVRDLLQLNRPSNEPSLDHPSSPRLKGVATFFMRPTVQR